MLIKKIIIIIIEALGRLKVKFKMRCVLSVQAGPVLASEAQ